MEDGRTVVIIIDDDGYLISPYMEDTEKNKKEDIIKRAIKRIQTSKGFYKFFEWFSKQVRTLDWISRRNWQWNPQQAGWTLWSKRLYVKNTTKEIKTIRFYRYKKDSAETTNITIQLGAGGWVEMIHKDIVESYSLICTSEKD